jgi:hypothetical protein
MFDDIVYETPCPICGTLLKNWQSKSGGCALGNITPRELWKQQFDPYHRDELDRPGVNFYDNCGACGTWVEVSLREGRLPHSKEHRDRVMDEIKAEGLGLKEFYDRLGPEGRGPVIGTEE